MRIASLGHAVFAVVLISLGIFGLAVGDFTPVWEPVPKGTPARELLAYLCSVVSLTAGAGLLWARAAAARLLLIYVLLWVVCFRLPAVLSAPGSQEPWSGIGETAVMAAGAWALYALFAGEWDRQRMRLAVGARGIRIAQVLYALALIPFGTAHFVYWKETAALVPSWLPWPTAWAFATGAAYLAASAGILAGVKARLAASLSALQMGGFTLLVWVPILARGSRDPFQWSETVLSVALTAAAWVVADSFSFDRALGDSMEAAAHGNAGP